MDDYSITMDVARAHLIPAPTVERMEQEHDLLFIWNLQNRKHLKKECMVTLRVARYGLAHFVASRSPL